MKSVLLFLIFQLLCISSHATHGKRQGAICHDEQVAFLTFEGRKEAKKVVKTTFLQKK